MVLWDNSLFVTLIVSRPRCLDSTVAMQLVDYSLSVNRSKSCICISCRWRDGSMSLSQFCSASLAPFSPECSMMDAPWRLECRTCWPRLESENAMHNRITKKAPAWLSDVFGVNGGFSRFFFGLARVMIRAETTERRHMVSCNAHDLEVSQSIQ